MSTRSQRRPTEKLRQSKVAGVNQSHYGSRIASPTPTSQMFAHGPVHQTAQQASRMESPIMTAYRRNNLANQQQEQDLTPPDFAQKVIRHMSPLLIGSVVIFLLYKVF